jgi:hypothetical protein
VKVVVSVESAAAEQHEPAVGEQVAAEDPLQVLHREVQVAPDRGQRDIDDRRIDEVEERHRAQQRERELPAARRESRWIRGHGVSCDSRWVCQHWRAQP